uniref:Uncharacterized protein n=1 Tax=Parascaris equorum TaxID=6256 RepID=A0A914S7Y2_PAREQ
MWLGTKHLVVDEGTPKEGRTQCRGGELDMGVDSGVL